jgi:Acetyltransferase (GNAT) family
MNLCHCALHLPSQCNSLARPFHRRSACNCTNTRKILYRLRKANPLCIGLFTTVNPGGENTRLLTYNTSHPAETGSPRRSVLMAHILVTLTTNQTVQEEDMALPPDWKEPNPKSAPELGHKLHGRTLALHSLAVLPELQHARLGTTLLRSFIQMVKDAKVADRIALLTYERLVPWYSEFGFTSSGKSSNQHGGEDWYDLVSSICRHHTSSNVQGSGVPGG